MHRHIPLLVLVACAASLVGCGRGGPAREIQPSLDPAAVTRGIMQHADTDSDGFLKADELVRVPGLRSALTNLDRDGDGRLSAVELTEWLQAIQQSRVAITSVTIEITQQKRPLKNALVRLVPETFMGSGFQPAEGRTDASGMAAPAIPGGRFPGVNYCIYRVEITGTGIDGLPIPAKYNTATTLGLAVGADLGGGKNPTFNLD